MVMKFEFEIQIKKKCDRKVFLIKHFSTFKTFTYSNV